jgi:hypothetical protein
MIVRVLWKGKFVLQAMKECEGVQVPTLPPVKALVMSIELKAGWPPEPVWTLREEKNLLLLWGVKL